MAYESDAGLLRTAQAMARSGEYETCDQVLRSLLALGYRRAPFVLREPGLRAEVDRMCTGRG